VLAYLGWWVTGALVLLIERRDPFIRYHAAQAAVGLGAIWLAGLLVYGGAFLMLSASELWFRGLLWLSLGIWAAGFGVWIVGLVAALRGERWRIPLAAPLADRISRTS
jgi:uncharacterized membrane protein